MTVVHLRTTCLVVIYFVFVLGLRNFVNAQSSLNSDTGSVSNNYVIKVELPNAEEDGVTIVYPIEEEITKEVAYEADQGKNFVERLGDKIKGTLDKIVPIVNTIDTLITAKKNYSDHDEQVTEPQPAGTTTVYVTTDSIDTTSLLSNADASDNREAKPLFDVLSDLLSKLSEDALKQVYFELMDSTSQTEGDNTITSTLPYDSTTIPTTDSNTDSTTDTMTTFFDINANDKVSLMNVVEYIINRFSNEARKGDEKLLKVKNDLISTLERIARLESEDPMKYLTTEVPSTTSDDYTTTQSELKPENKDSDVISDLRNIGKSTINDLLSAINNLKNVLDTTNINDNEVSMSTTEPQQETTVLPNEETTVLPNEETTPVTNEITTKAKSSDRSFKLDTDSLSADILKLLRKELSKVLNGTVLTENDLLGPIRNAIKNVDSLNANTESEDILSTTTEYFTETTTNAATDETTAITPEVTTDITTTETQTESTTPITIEIDANNSEKVFDDNKVLAVLEKSISKILENILKNNNMHPNETTSKSTPATSSYSPSTEPPVELSTTITPSSNRERENSDQSSLTDTLNKVENLTNYINNVIDQLNNTSISVDSTTTSKPATTTVSNKANKSEILDIIKDEIRTLLNSSTPESNNISDPISSSIQKIENKQQAGEFIDKFNSENEILKPTTYRPRFGKNRPRMNRGRSKKPIQEEESKIITVPVPSSVIPITTSEQTVTVSDDFQERARRILSKIQQDYNNEQKNRKQQPVYQNKNSYNRLQPSSTTHPTFQTVNPYNYQPVNSYNQADSTPHPVYKPESQKPYAYQHPDNQYKSTEQENLSGQRLKEKQRPNYYQQYQSTERQYISEQKPKEEKRPNFYQQYQSTEPQIITEQQLHPKEGQRPNYYQQYQSTEQPAVDNKRRGSIKYKNTIPILRDDRDFDGKGYYKYDYLTANGINSHEEGHLKYFGSGESGEVVHGGYSWTDADGKVYRVDYTADENGFHPVGDHLPTPPPIPKEIARSLFRRTSTTDRPVYVYRGSRKYKRDSY